MSVVVLDIGADVGALVLYTPGELDEREIEVSRAGERRTHSQVHRRDTGDFAAVYPSLPAGEYTIWHPDDHAHGHHHDHGGDHGHAVATFTITGGSVTHCRWPS
jgi:hypothetical protein